MQENESQKSEDSGSGPSSLSQPTSLAQDLGPHLILSAASYGSGVRVVHSAGAGDRNGISTSVVPGHTSQPKAA